MIGSCLLLSVGTFVVEQLGDCDCRYVQGRWKSYTLVLFVFIHFFFIVLLSGSNDKVPGLVTWFNTVTSGMAMRS